MDNSITIRGRWPAEDAFKQALDTAKLLYCSVVLNYEGYRIEIYPEDRLEVLLGRYAGFVHGN